uniref:Uncharacterized protein n=1 Tax=Anopheles arabiensis TaxID=7173 RepID=A0A182IFS6_ANOAR
ASAVPDLAASSLLNDAARCLARQRDSRGVEQHSRFLLGELEVRDRVGHSWQHSNQ